MTKPRRSKVKLFFSILFRTLFIAFISFIIGFNIYAWNAKAVLGNSLPMPFGYGVAVVLSGSMEPELSVDDLVVIKETDDIAVNDVIVYQTGSSLVIHRVMSIDGDTVITQGDANNTADEPITLDTVKGKLVFAIPFVGAVTRAVRTPAIVIFIVVAALLLLELSYRKERKAEEQKKVRIRDELSKLRTPDAELNDFSIEELKASIEKLEKELMSAKGGDSNDN